VEKISVNKGILIGVVVVAAVSLLALVFLLGRESGSGSVSAPSTRIERVAPRAQEGLPPLPTSAAVLITEHPETRPTPRLSSRASPPGPQPCVRAPKPSRRKS
jgi:hypothetical protein